MKIDEANLDSDRWDKVEVGFLCRNDVTTIQTCKRRAQRYPDSRVPADVHHEDLIPLNEAGKLMRLRQPLSNVMAKDSLIFGGKLF